MILFVVFEPAEIRGVYNSWPACKQAIGATTSVHLETARTSEEAEALLVSRAQSRGEPQASTI